MSQVRQTTPQNLTEGYPVTNLTLVVLLLIPCVVILLLLNCFFLGYKLLVLSKRTGRQRREDTEEMLLRSALPRLTVSDVAYSPLRDGRTACVSLSEPVLSHPVTSSRASSRDRDGAGLTHRIRLLRPDGATGSGSLRAPSTIQAGSSAQGFSPRLRLPPGSRTYSVSKPGWCRSAPVLLRSSDSDAETRVNLVPPNSPMQETERVGDIRWSSSYKKLMEVNTVAPGLPYDKLVLECEHPTPETSSLNTSAVGPGLDSDFGASAGVSLRILSGDSDGLSNGLLSSALEWDYYDPCYVRQNNIPKHNRHRPLMHAKQYWV
ncbi:protein huluwa isoform X1 [Fundulus heteroclitus]|uniref:protein huluwa isoform X1 n=1 Tax=Fundulus heteroclitus TaxID=8078 RepID=UPI00165AFA1F|nr:protein huluwa isoform X1 [Fundulus heteroclitus]